MYQTLRKTSDLSSNSFTFEPDRQVYSPMSNNEIHGVRTDPSLNNTKAPHYINYNLRFNQNKESDIIDQIQET